MPNYILEKQLSPALRYAYFVHVSKIEDRLPRLLLT